MKAFTLLLLLCFSLAAASQLRSVTVQVSGLTCAMCSKAVQKSLEQLSFIQDVKPDLKTQEYAITFRENKPVSFAEIKKSIEAAGFSVARFQLNAHFDNALIKAGQPVAFGTQRLYFLNAANETLNGAKTLVIVEKGFLTAKALKNYCSDAQLKCLEPLKAETPGQNYHVIITPA